MSRGGLHQIAALVVVVILLLMGGLFWQEISKSLRPKKPASQETSGLETPAETLDLVTGVQEGLIEARFHGNGLTEITWEMSNLTDRSIGVSLSPGLILVTQDGEQQSVLLEAAHMLLGAKAKDFVPLSVGPLRKANTPGQHRFAPSAGKIELVQSLLGHPRGQSASPEALRTAIFVLLNNPPLAMVASFKLATQEAAAEEVVPHFQTSTPNLMEALLLIKALPNVYQTPRLSESSQLKLEALVDPASHDMALEYYDISREAEWDFWQTELLHGDPATRHYALYGIARYYPDVAYEMLPQWVSNTQVNPNVRAAAIYALAEIEREEALRALIRLQGQLAGEPNIAATLERAVGLAQQRLQNRSQ
ncbi:MAG: HEAT repeat domain-containing protein [Verrucomicrobiales bacterium]